ncbi:MAG TPA: PH domain-containing protein [Chloroflexia bacterium]
MNTTFRVAPFSVTTWIWTGTFFVVLAFFLWRMVANGASDPFDVGVSVLLSILIVLGFVRSVRAYHVTDRTIEVARTLASRIRLDRAEIASIEVRPNLGSFFNRSILATGGLFGWSGKARIRKPTDIDSLEAEVFGTNPANAVLVELKSGRNVVLTPADPTAFVAAVRGPKPRQEGNRGKGKKN